MKQSLLMEKYPVFDLILPKPETTFDSAEAIIEALKAKVEAHPKVAYIATFDHYAHTKAIGGAVGEGIAAAYNLVFCFGLALPRPHVLSVRPRSIGVADMGDHYHITFMEPPMEAATKEMESWCKALADKT
ncbi:hypothetical protein C8N32_11183 [Rhodovulum imhoffii]|uniref:Uncharacterized protein n=1 Tax=Rhodovulum imhoffii TaxID=365340 RepID=A0A2T5BR35_9RHOB|nr:hypothetical protein [Rhodovulum imhoffii]MBK5934965.1 hypothetical protein [Rhodovulum imhoffii]PTN01684.1 hypothetical protein C8N32_11183 [Rhodovulum imhoffii]